MKIPLIYNIRSVRQRPVSTLTTALGMALVVLVFVAMMALSRGFETAITGTGSRDNALVVRSGSDNELTSGLSRATAQTITSMPFVAEGPSGRPLVSPEVYVLVSIDRLDGGDALVVARGVSPQAFEVRKNVEIIAGRPINSGASEILVGKSIVGRFAGTEVGATLSFGNREWTVVGHFAAAGSGFESEIWGENEQFMPAFRGEVFQSLTFRMTDPSAFESIKSMLEDDPRLPVSVYREYNFYADQSVLLTQIINFAAVFIAGIMAIGAVFGAINTMYASIGARSSEIAVLLTLGFRPFSVMSSFLYRWCARMPLRAPAQRDRHQHDQLGLDERGGLRLPDNARLAVAWGDLCPGDGTYRGVLPCAPRGATAGRPDRQAGVGQVGRDQRNISVACRQGDLAATAAQCPEQCAVSTQRVEHVEASCAHHAVSGAGIELGGGAQRDGEVDVPVTR